MLKYIPLLIFPLLAACSLTPSYNAQPSDQLTIRGYSYCIPSIAVIGDTRIENIRIYQDHELIFDKDCNPDGKWTKFKTPLNVTRGVKYTVMTAMITEPNWYCVKKVFTDWNQDGIFDDQFIMQKKWMSTDVDLTKVDSQRLVIPSDALLGVTDLRWMYGWTDPAYVQACSIEANPRNDSTESDGMCVDLLINVN